MVQKNSKDSRPAIQLRDLFSPVSQGVEEDGRIWTLCSPWSYLHRLGNVLLLALLLFFALFFRGSDGIGLGVAGSVALFVGILILLAGFQYAIFRFGRYDWEVVQEADSDSDFGTVSHSDVFSDCDREGPMSLDSSTATESEETPDLATLQMEFQALEQKQLAMQKQRLSLVPKHKPLPLPAPDELTIRKQFRNWIPGVYEFETEEGNWVLMLQPWLRKLMNWLLIFLLLIPLYLFTWSQKQWIWVYAAFIAILFVAVCVQVYLLYSTQKHPKWFEVHPFGETPYSQYLQEKRKKHSRSQQSKEEGKE